MNTCDFISYPISSIQGTISIPGDKSISHRAIMLGSIAKGVTEVRGFLNGEDCLATLRALSCMGVHIERPSSNYLIIHGVGKHGLKAPKRLIDCGNSGTSMRLLAGLLAGQAFDSELTGDSSLLKRPMSRISIPLMEMGAQVITQDGKPPLTIKGNKSLHAISYTMPVASAQVKSCILLAGLYATGRTEIIEPGISRDHTEKMLKTFGFPIAVDNAHVSISSDGEGEGTVIEVPGDISSAAFFMVAASIIKDSNILLKNVGINPTRTGIISILMSMGADIQIENNRFYGEELVADIRIRYAPLKGIQIPSELVPVAIDEFPAIFIAASCAQGTTTLRGAQELRVKESDRIGVMAQGLLSLGIELKTFEDGIEIVGGAFKGGEVDSQGDHRIAMSFAIAGACASSCIKINNCANVSTSFPGFIKAANSIRFKIKELINND